MTIAPSAPGAKFPSGLAAPREYVADMLKGQTPPLRDLSDQRLAFSQLADYTTRRVLAVCSSLSERPIVMLSGGVDSMVVAATLARENLNPLCVTVNFANGGSEDSRPAAEFANKLNLEHINAEIDEPTTNLLVGETVQLLKNFELWEVAAGVSLRAVLQILESHIPEFHDQSPVFTGGGADVLLGGGWMPSNPPNSLAGNEEVRAHIWNSVQNSFCHERYIPDFHNLILGERENQFINTFQTFDAWTTTARFSPEVLYTVDPTHSRYFDKSCIRDLAIQLGVPPHLAWVKKTPLQLSSGLFSVLSQAARKWVSQQKGSATYSNPLTEPAEFTLSRVWLESIYRDIYNDDDGNIGKTPSGL